MKLTTLVAVSAVLVIAVGLGCHSQPEKVSTDSREKSAGGAAVDTRSNHSAAESGERIERLHWEEAGAITIPVSGDLIELGRATYNTRCLICHGKNGGGDGLAAAYLDTKPRNFTRIIFKYRSTPQGSFPHDTDLFRSITVGFPIYGMPPFSYLSERERWGLVYYVRKLSEDGFRKDRKADGLDPDLIDTIVRDRLASGKSLDVGKAPEWSDQAVARGKRVYEEYRCAACHGETGMGDGPSAADQQDTWGNDISPVPFALNPYFMKAGGRPRDIVRVLMTGVGGTGMPMYQPEQPDDLWNLAYYVLQLSRDRSEKQN